MLWHVRNYGRSQKSIQIDYAIRMVKNYVQFVGNLSKKIFV